MEKKVRRASVAFLQGLIVLIVTLFFGFKIANLAMLLLALLFMFLIAVLFSALGTAILSKLNDMQAFPLVMNFIIMPLFFLSGALFPLDGVPRALKIVTMFNSLSYGVDGIRAAFGIVAYFGVRADLLVVVFVTWFMLRIGSWLFSKIRI